MPQIKPLFERINLPPVAVNEPLDKFALFRNSPTVATVRSPQLGNYPYA